MSSRWSRTFAGARPAKLLLAIAALATFAGCGFQLRSDPVVPPSMSRTYIATNDRYSLFYRTFRMQLEDAGAELVDSPVDATAEFAILTDDTGQRVLSVSARNVPTEFEVYYTVYYTVRSGEKTLLEPQLQTLTRDYTYDETRVLGKAREEELLRKAIVDDLVRLVLVQVSSIQ
ncbi:MAG TPA: LPS assembly lipoprotein LptE [Woeseiaceae bacterium]|nr:LPS assembly lipoprotein LptE [Woeseiaceae bacterium]